MQKKKEANFNPSSNLAVDFAVNLNTKNFGPVIGREDEINQLIEILSRRNKSNPVLVGDPGVGKTEIIHGLVNKIKMGDVPKNLFDRPIMSLDLAMLGNNLAAIKNVLINVVLNNGILFIDEIHNIVGAGRTHGSLDLANVLKPILTDSSFSCIGATTTAEYQKYFEKDSALVRRFSKINIAEPSEKVCLKILTSLKDSYERHHNVTICPTALESCIQLSVKYMADRRLPDKAFDLLDESCSKKSLQTSRLSKALDESKACGINNKDLARLSELNYSIIPALEKELGSSLVLPQDIQKVVSQKTGIPVGDLTKSEKEKLINLEADLKREIIGQDLALETISNHIRTQKVGLDSDNCSFLFLGTTGVGKTQTAKALAKTLFHSEKNIIRFDMSEYQEKHEVSKLIGAPNGYVGFDEGGLLTNRVKTQPYSIVLFDEIEKAHPDICDILLQVLDDNHLTDNKGQVVDFSNVVIIITSNLKKEELGKNFRVEFLNRIDETIVFNSLSLKDLEKITLFKLEKLTDKFKRETGIDIYIKKCIIRQLVDRSFNIKYGAREVDRLIHKLVKIPLSQELLKDGPKKKAIIIPTSSNNNLIGGKNGEEKESRQ